jgi:hypothetical protein
VQRFTDSPSSQPTEVPASVEPVLASSGQPLERGLREDMEARFGHDFSRVRIHTDRKATDSAMALDAEAYTFGTNIVFANGHAQSTEPGKRLLAHELTHVVQQNPLLGQKQIGAVAHSLGHSSRPVLQLQRRRHRRRSSDDGDSASADTGWLDFLEEEREAAPRVEELKAAFQELEQALPSTSDWLGRAEIGEAIDRAREAYNAMNRSQFTAAGILEWVRLIERVQQLISETYHISPISDTSEIASLWHRVAELRVQLRQTDFVHAEELPQRVESMEVTTESESEHASATLERNPEEEIRDALSPEPDISLATEVHHRDPHWFIEANPPSPIVRQGTSVTFGPRWSSLPLDGDSRAEPTSIIDTVRWQEPLIFGVRGEDGTDSPWEISELERVPLRASHIFQSTGRKTVYFRGTPLTYSGDPTPIEVTYELYVIPTHGQPDARQLSATANRTIEEEDRQAIVDPSASDGAILMSFRRLAIRRGLQILSDNMREANNLEQVYLSYSLETTPRVTTTRELLPVYLQLVERRDAILEREEFLSSPWVQARLGTVDSPEEINSRRTELHHRIQPAIDQIEAGFPEIVAYARNMAPDPSDFSISEFRDRMLRVIDIVQGSIADTRVHLISGNLNILEVQHVVNAELRQWDSNPRVRRAVLAGIDEQAQEEFLQQILLMGVPIVLAFVPGIGALLSASASAVIGGVQTALSWERVETLRAAANAGLREGPVSEEQVDAARLEAVLNAIGTLVDVADFADEATRVLGAFGREMSIVDDVGEALGDGSGRRTTIRDEAGEEAFALDFYESQREIPMLAHIETPDGIHHLEAYGSGIIGRCSPVAPGEHCPLLRFVYQDVLMENSALREQVIALERRLAEGGEEVADDVIAEAAAMEANLRQLQREMRSGSATSTVFGEMAEPAHYFGDLSNEEIEDLLRPLNDMARDTALEAELAWGASATHPSVDVVTWIDAWLSNLLNSEDGWRLLPHLLRPRWGRAIVGSILDSRVMRFIRNSLQEHLERLGARVWSNRTLGTIGISDEIATLTVDQYLARYPELVAMLPPLSESMRQRVLGRLRPDLFTVFNSGQGLIWDLTSETAAEHMAKTMLYGHILSREGRVNFVTFSETYWIRPN